MNPYRLTRHATGDLKSLALRTRKRSGDAAAKDTVDSLLADFDLLASSPGLGHRREDLTARPYYFYSVKPYLIVYARQIDPLPILAVLHGSRDVRRLRLQR